MPKPRTHPRKRPRQARSNATVEAILQAATYILVKDGWARFTTNRIAERAGVNIASLYQYFPNKESIVIELQRRHMEKATRAAPDAIATLQAKGDLRALFKALATASMEEHRAAPALHRVFAEELPRSARRANPAHEAQVHALLMSLVRPHARNVPDLDLATFIVRAAGHAIVHEAANERPELLERPEFAEEIALLMERYLCRPEPPAAKRSKTRAQTTRK
ncbi:TetR/AcrR family transcriptional regulator [Dyella monticola]|uniref:TetR/AcrR family transcriptional regulator n=1 Tax=Dyella monticola TaxID=1927958 RepID=A0A370X9G6_9GAMM|nr:TetR/AcrR family transcriptional regulator [Dyella monticola]RDS84917.1 TetR/AcrR family transcriptional regulator [Dyella monticola]